MFPPQISPQTHRTIWQTAADADEDKDWNDERDQKVQLRVSRVEAAGAPLLSVSIALVATILALVVQINGLGDVSATQLARRITQGWLCRWSYLVGDHRPNGDCSGKEK